MFPKALFALAALLAPSDSPSARSRSGAVRVDDLRRHIELLASDEFEGRKPGTPGETKTLHYIAIQLAGLGLQPGSGDSWYQPVPLMERRTHRHRALFAIGGMALDFGGDEMVLVGREPVEAIRDAPVYFVGMGAVGKDIQGAVALMLAEGPRLSDRVKAVQQAGAAAVITIVPDPALAAVRNGLRQGQTRLQSETVPQVQGAISLSAVKRAADVSGLDFAELSKRASNPDFRPVLLRTRATLNVRSYVNSYSSYNLVGRLRGTGSNGEAVLFLGHWDHLGICRPDSAEDRICNGAVDNASGIAMLIEVARRLAAGPRPVRDILFMATTAEEMGLLGAKHFAAQPTLPLTSIVAAVNADTVAVHGRGEPVAIIGRGYAALDRVIAQTVREAGRRLDEDKEADAFVMRQDGWELARAGVPAVMVGGSFSNMATLGAFLSGPYHKPEDDLRRPIQLEGAAEDADLLVALGSNLANPKVYEPARR